MWVVSLKTGACMATDDATNHVVTLEEVLDNREARVERQRASLARGGTVVSFTVNMPGPVKDSDDSRIAFRAGLRGLEAAAAERGFVVLEREERYLLTGPEALLRFAEQPLDVKRMTVDVEENHALGRLFDMDVLGPDGRGVSRSGLGLAGRTCLICGQPAAVCGRSRAHGVGELVAAVRGMVAGYAASGEKR